uniref:FeS cluster biogenesis domain-containing protein n=1 Tax=Aegilops tauschii TaxID=37682 RepID=M8BUA9_AEGTA
MALASGTTAPPLLGRLPGTARPHLAVSPSPSAPVSSVRFAARAGGSRAVSLRASAPPAAATATPGSIAPAISLTEKALKHLNRMRSEKNEDLCLRIGVKQGGCSGMSYTMEFESRGSANPDDSVIEYEGFTIVCDPKSLLFMFGMELDYSDALIGGGFNFQNPNATKTCGCGGAGGGNDMAGCVIVGKGDSRNESEMGMPLLIMESLAKPRRRLSGVGTREVVMEGVGVTSTGTVEVGGASLLPRDRQDPRRRSLLRSAAAARPPRACPSKAKFGKFDAADAPTEAAPAAPATSEADGAAEQAVLEDDSCLPPDLEGAIWQSGKASADFVNSGGMRGIAELLIPQLEFLNQEGAQAEVWALSRILLDTLAEETGQVVKAVFPDAGVAALLKHQWKDAKFKCARLGFQKPTGF